jgi:hypothetical protein
MQKTIKPKKMKNTIIGTNHHAKHIAQCKNNVAEQNYTQALSLVSEFCPVTDEALFRSSFVGYVTAFIKKDKFLSLIDINSIINLKRLQFIEQRYKEYRTEIDPSYFDYVATKTEQITAFNYATALSKLLNEHPQGKLDKDIIIPLLINTEGVFSINPGQIVLL